ncbi:hypothetical protein FNO01nite_07510 [Flavobacterium noncentrifugens]|uniref:Uncharacterized protein n=1 Tax=Flavobacterium noncentrifugens TaxID=1128970 RepID=A0A1G8T439_9FLAO|nr:tetratricopeptide repeat protein [Flavobacterium noncentrifugens]GEP50079.1 hypothetical protein FNO01nite_07510 [Flavobacterium noncentrifugens]SDJ36177.1 hypothetical protein SAMN04487935_0815 [Flavobacterium noncentrifugens]
MNIKFMIPILLLLSNVTRGQKDKQPDVTFTFDTDFFDAANHWVVLSEKTKDSLSLGYIYLDEYKGFSFVLENNFKVDKNGKFQFGKQRSGYIIKRALNDDTGKVFVLKKDNIKTLDLPEKPEWLKVYDMQQAPETFIRKGSFYNRVGCSQFAIALFEEASLLKPHAENLDFELAVAYNATQQYQKTISLMNAAIAYNPRNFMLYRELGFALIQMGKVPDAEQIYIAGLNYCKNSDEKFEMCLDMVQTFFERSDKTKFQKWFLKSKKYLIENSKHLKSLEKFEGKTDP